jgi:acyl carrier protein
VSTIDTLRTLPRSDRREALESLVVAEFSTALMLDANDPLPRTESYFALGLTSLALMDVKERLEAMLGAAISANALFNHPTVAGLMDHLVEDVVPGLFAARNGGSA